MKFGGGSSGFAGTVASSRLLNSIANLQANTVGGTGVITVTGYYARNDGGGGVYFYDSADVTSADNGGTIIVDASGRRWKLWTPDGVVSALQFGAKGDGATDDTARLQAGLDFMLTAPPLVHTYLFPVNKTYKITDSLLIGKNNGSAWSFVGGFNVSAGAARTQINSSTIDHSAMLTKPALIIQLGRAITIEGLKFAGPNNFQSNLADYDSYFTAANFIVGAVATGRWNPQCAICVDPYHDTPSSGDTTIGSNVVANVTGTVYWTAGDVIRATGIPVGTTVTLVGANSLTLSANATATAVGVKLYDQSIEYPGHAARYLGTGSSGSSRLHFRGLYVQNNVVGLMQNPNWSNQQGEDVHVEDCTFHVNQSHIATGQDQSRSCSASKCLFEYSQYVMNGLGYGRQIGVSHNFDRCDFLLTWFILNADAARGGVHVASCYAEQFVSLGRCASQNANDLAAQFTGCDFRPNLTNKTPEFHFLTYSHAQFTGCTLKNGVPTMPLKFVVADQQPKSPGLVFDSCKFGESNSSTPITCNDWRRVRFRNCAMIDSLERDGWSLLTDFLAGAATSTFNGKLIPLGAQLALNGSLYAHLDNPASYSLGAISNVSIVGSTLTFDSTNAANVIVGDLIIQTGNAVWADLLNGYINLCVGRVSNVTANTITVPNIPYSLTVAGSLAACALMPMQKWHESVTGDLSSGSATITNCSPDPTTIWRAGDVVRAAAGIPAGARVVSVTATTIVMSVNATANITGASLYDMTRNLVTPTVV